MNFNPQRALVGCAVVLLIQAALASTARAENGYVVQVMPRGWDTPLSGCRAVAVGGEILVYGGAKNGVKDGRITSEFEGRLRKHGAGDGLDGDWSVLEPRGEGPTARSYGSLTLDGKGRSLYLFGGYAPEFQNEMWRFDLKKSAWEKLPTGGDEGPAPRDAHVACEDAAGKGLLIFGGLQKSGFEADLWHFNYKSNQWTRIPEKAVWPAARFTCGLCEIADGRAVVFGGLDHEAKPTAETWLLDTKKLEWKQLASAPMPLSAPSVVWHPKLERVVVLGGSSRGNGASRSVWCYDPRKDEWCRAGDLAEPIAHATAVYCEKSDRIVLIGGTVSHFGAAHPDVLIQEVTITRE